ncbi:putative oxidoreductase [Gordonia hirsuta DSM 44140 = NBRC 16056]|uniref:nitric oxide dioxygenase n=1 Tax=Gordonia hirsuta DSM 44140 = NBRC 16056 TaxID=1121927 RepID=L7LE18_9ACTN|nr:FAD-binding oxidoreductase [Gordonia hirsuta]GAC58298.1 putative oxidoreductase [Gordonia hirsuta DSM 44140 = NBRC 16056]
MSETARPVLHDLRDRLAADPDTFARNVFARLFGSAPTLRDMFPAHLSHLREAFTDVIEHVLDVLPGDDGHDELIELLAQLGRDHRKYGVTEEHYNVMAQALVDEAAAALGPRWDRATAETVAQAIMLTTGVMRGAAQSVPGPATWRAQVVQKFDINRERVVVRLIALDPMPQFRAGQYLETRIPQWPHAWRNLSPSIPPNDAGELEFHVRSVPGGHVSTSIVKETAPGDIWTFAQAHGTLQVEAGRSVLMVAGGTGLAPLRAILLSMALHADSAPTHLFYGARFPGELYELGMLRELAAVNPWLKVTAVVDDSTDPWWVEGAPDPHQWGFEVLRGRVGDIVAQYGDWTDRQVLIAGPADMITSTKLKLRMAGVPTDQMQHDPVLD